MARVDKDGFFSSQDSARLLPALGVAPPRGNGHGAPHARKGLTPTPWLGGRFAGTWFERIEQQLDRTERRYRERREARESVLHQLHDEGRTPLEVDSPERVQARLRRLGIEALEPAAEGPDSMRFLTQVVPNTAEPLKLAYERVLGSNDLTSICFLERGLKVSRSVGRVRIGDSRGRVVGYGTGFLVSPRLMLTNNHVLRDAAEAGNSQIEFNYQAGLDGAALPSVIFELDPAAFFVTDAALDYTLVAVKETSLDGSSLGEFGFNRLIEAQGKVLVGEYLNIVQHPNGEPKQLALRENQLVDLLDHYCHYQTDTAPGSSGSPVYNDQWEVVALHHMGVPKRTEDGRYLTVDGEFWQPGMDSSLLAWKANEGTRVSSILRHLRAQSLSAEASRLRAELIESSPGAPAVHAPPIPEVRSTLPSSRPALAPVQVPGEVSGMEGFTTLVVPLRVSIQVGPPGGGATGMVALQATPGLPVARATVPRQPAKGETAQDQLMEEALAELERMRRRPYFDEKASREAQERYYKDIGDEPDFETLSTLVRGTHRKQLRYAPMRHVYPWVDLHPDGRLRSIYSGKSFDPEAFIREDARIDRVRAERFREVLAVEAALSAEAMAAQLDQLEAALPYNCEHVVPQSWFGKREPMRGDLHHLFACESGCNSFRGNTPYFDFPDFEEAVREECGRRVANKFEPTFGKGTVARATLYFLLRYPGEINRTSTEYEEDRLMVLLRWHMEDPPSLYERHRNEAIFALQGNRNPFIDLPEWAGQVDVRAGLG